MHRITSPSNENRRCRCAGASSTISSRPSGRRGNRGPAHCRKSLSERAGRVARPLRADPARAHRDRGGRGRGGRRRAGARREDDHPRDPRRLRARRVPGVRRLDWTRSATCSTCPRARLRASSELAAAYPGFESAPCRLSVARATRCSSTGGSASRESVVIEAGTHDESVRMRTKDLVRTDRRAARRPLPRLTGEQARGRFAATIPSPRRRSSAGRALHS